MTVIDAPHLDRLIVCHHAWEEALAELGALAGNAPLFRPGRKVEAARNLVNSWSHHHTPYTGLPEPSARRLRATWIVRLLRRGIDLSLVAQAAGVKPAALAAYLPWVPPIEPAQRARLLRDAA